MIPKIIHYCWMNKGPYPPKVQECIETWHKVLPDYEFMLWNYDRFPRGKSQWVDEAYDNQKYAFCADYLRVFALTHYGGIYLDTDVSVIKSFNDLLHLPYFICCENSHSDSCRIDAGTIGCEKGWDIMVALEQRYHGRHFQLSNSTCDVTVLPAIIYKAVLALKKPRLISSSADFDYDKGIINIFPSDYFSPKDIMTGEIIVTDNTYTIHNFSGSWITKEILDEWNGKRRKSFRRLSIDIVKQFFLLHKDIIILSNSPIILQFYLFWNLQPRSPLVNTHISEEDFIKLMQLLSNNKPFNIEFINSAEAKKKPNDLYPIIRIVGTDIEIHYPACESKQQITTLWDDYFKSNKNAHIVTIFCSNANTNIGRFKALNINGGITVGNSGDIIFDLNNGNINWRNHRLMLRLGGFANKQRRR